MPWQEVTAMKLRREFVLQALKAGANISSLCRDYNIQRKTGYKWVNRYLLEGLTSLNDRSRCPKRQPLKTDEKVVQELIRVRLEHPAWGSRKLKKYLENKGLCDLPATSTITDILRRAGLIEQEEATKHKPWKRFEAEKPNRLWQMDFKGHIEMEQGRCHPLTVLDDHSRFSLGLRACNNERRKIVQDHLLEIFERYGLPERINTDNGPPWGSSNGPRYTKFSVWLIRLGINVSHSGYYHPQTNGKEERFHRTLKTELLKYHYFRDCAHAQIAFNEWRDCYNLERPHEAINMETPISRYQLLDDN